MTSVCRPPPRRGSGPRKLDELGEWAILAAAMVGFAGSVYVFSTLLRMWCTLH